MATITVPLYVKIGLAAGLPSLGIGEPAFTTDTFKFYVGSGSGNKQIGDTSGSQPLDATLTALAGANWSANSLAIGSGSDTVAQVTFAANTFPARSSTGNLVAKTITDFALTFLDDTTAAAVATTLVLGTGDSPQFTAVNIGHATDTTITRVSAGVIAVEGATLYAQGGALGTPASGVLTNCTGTASGLTAGSVTTNANLTGNVTSVGNATTIAAGVVTNSMLAGSIATSKLASVTTVGTNLIALANPSAITFPRINADNSVSTLDAATFRTAIGAGTGSGTVTAVSITTANGISGSSSGGATPALTLALAAITPTTVSATGALSVTVDNAATTTATTLETLTHTSSGTTSIGFGITQLLQLETASGTTREAYQIDTTLKTATDASRKMAVVHSVYDTAIRECLRMESSGSAAMISFLGSPAVAAQTGDVGTALVTFGLMTGTPTFSVTNITGFLPQNLIILREEQTQNTAGGTFTSGAWRTRTLNTEVVDSDNLCTLSSNQFTLTAGTYEIEAFAPAGYCNGHQARLYNVTDSTVVLLGTSEFSSQAETQYLSGASKILGRFTIAASKALELQHQCALTFATNGFGAASNFTTEVFSVVRLKRIA